MKMKFYTALVSLLFALTGVLRGQAPTATLVGQIVDPTAANVVGAIHAVVKGLVLMALSRRVSAEFIGTFWLVFGGCGSAVLAAAFPQTGIGFAGVALAFGLTLLTMAYAIGSISGCHINPAVTFGLWLAKRFPARDVLPYWIAQVLGEGVLRDAVRLD